MISNVVLATGFGLILTGIWGMLTLATFCGLSLPFL